MAPRSAKNIQNIQKPCLSLEEALKIESRLPFFTRIEASPSFHRIGVSLQLIPGLHTYSRKELPRNSLDVLPEGVIFLSELLRLLYSRG